MRDLLENLDRLITIRAHYKMIVESHNNNRLKEFDSREEKEFVIRLINKIDRLLVKMAPDVLKEMDNLTTAPSVSLDSVKADKETEKKLVKISKEENAPNKERVTIKEEKTKAVPEIGVNGEDVGKKKRGPKPKNLESEPSGNLQMVSQYEKPERPKTLEEVQESGRKGSFSRR